MAKAVTIASVTPDDVFMSIFGGEDAIGESYSYLYGWLLSKREVVVPTFAAALSSIWGWKSVSIRQEKDGVSI